MDLNNVTWSWVEMCGPGGLVPWYPSKHDIGACFQQIYLQVPVLLLFAIVSAYFYGNRYDRRNRLPFRRWTIRARVACCIGIALVPLIKAIIGSTYIDAMFRPVDYLTSGVELIAWFVHTGYVHSLRHRPKVHGPILMRVLWTLTAVLSIINLRSLALARDDLATTISFYCGVVIIVFQVLYGLTFASFLFRDDVDGPGLVNEVSPLIGSYYSSFREEVDPSYLGVALEHTSKFSRLLFYWVYPLLKKGLDGKVRACDDLYDLPSNLQSSTLCAKLHKSLYGDCSMYPADVMPRMSLVRALHKCFGLEFYSVGILKFLADVLGFGGPLILNQLVLFIEEKDQESNRGYQLAAALCGITLLASIFSTHFNFCMARVGLKLRGALITTIYRKTVSISFASVNCFTVGEIVNFMSTDTDRIVNACPSFHTLWSIPFQIAVSFYLLHQQVGISFLAGVVFTLILIPINKLIASKIGLLSTKMMTAKDERVSVMAEMLRAIRVLKLHVWEEHFLEKIMGIRQTELKHLRGRKYLDALCVYFWASTPVLVSILTLATYVLLGNKLTAATVFTTVALLNMLIGPLNAFPWVLNGLVEAWVSVQRIQKLFNTPNIDLRDYYVPGPEPITLKHLSVEWSFTGTNEQAEAAAPWGLQDVNLEVKKGQLVGVIGVVGCGKSTLIHAILGELARSVGEITVVNWEGGFGLVTQTAWLQHGSLRDNILFGKSYDSVRYKAVLDACCLSEDVTAMMGGDMARVGEGGTALSGGQKARLALARAVYQDKDIYLLDDIFSSLDPPVARHIYTKVVCGLLKEKIRILCTNNVQFLTNADVVVEIDRGQIVQLGTPAQVLPNYDDLNSCETESVDSYKETRDESEAELEPDQEVSESGAVKPSVYGHYLSAMGGFLVIAILSSLVLMQTSRNLTDYWLSVWVSASNVTTGPASTHYYLIVYTSLAVSNTFFTLIRAFLFAFGGLSAAQIIHEKLVNKVMVSKVTFFDFTPLGRILNRFSSDTYTVDDSLPFITNILSAQVFGLVGSLSITIYGLPWLCLLIAPLVPVYHYLQAMYRPTSRDLKRISSTTLSPLYSHFNETLQGMIVIRAFRCITRFQQRNEEYLERNQRAMFAGFATNTWLALRLQLMGVTMVSGVALVAVLQHQFDVIDPALVGLTIAYALSVTNLLSGVVSAFAETEREFVALERVTQYINEMEPETTGGVHPPYGWPSLGVISFQSVYLRYREQLAPSLNGISFETRPAEKIGVVGRTGAGKTSLITALLRLVNVYSGQIIIDTVPINNVLLPSLRSRITVIPQDPHLFKGTIRSNLDPLSEYRDTELFGVLKKCQMLDTVNQLGGLLHPVEINGRNFSQGQRQLFCLARAVLKNSKIVCVDEATASVDEETDRCIQLTIRSCFRQSTVLTIAHRISTVMDSDRLLVLRNGEVVEFDTPDNLTSDPTSYFFKLAQRSG